MEKETIMPRTLTGWEGVVVGGSRKGGKSHVEGRTCRLGVEEERSPQELSLKRWR